MAVKKKEHALTIDDKLKAALVSEDEQPYKIPENWVWTRVEMAFDEVKEKTIPTQNTDIAFIGLEHLQSGGGIVSKGDSQDVKSTKTLFRAGDVLYGKLRPYLNKHVLVDFAGIASTDILVFRSKGILDSRLLDGYFGLSHVVNYAQGSSKGINLPRVSPRVINCLPVPLPPLLEQQRIAEKLESLLCKVKAARALLDEIPEILQNFRQTVLAAACSGGLTEDWRVETVMTTDQSRRVDGCTDFDFELPTGWILSTAEQVCSSVRDGTHDTPKYVESGIPLITSKNIRPSGIDFNNAQQISLEDHLEISKRSGVDSGDILFSMIGSIGHVCLVETEREFSIKNVGLFKKNAAVVAPKYLFYWLQTQALMSWLQPKLRGGSQRFASLGLLRAFPVVVPPITEQHEIVRRVESLFAKADDLETQYREAMELIGTLPEVILSKAFRGELVPQDPNDEPANKLLERILSQKTIVVLQVEKAKSFVEASPVRIKIHKSKISGQSVKRSLHEVVGETRGGITPEELFRKAGYKFEELDDVEAFYMELSKEIRAERIIENRSHSSDIITLEKTL